MQVITDVFDLGYISNFHCRFYGAPALAEVIFHPLEERPRSNYQSVHGVTYSPYSPSECSQWWYRFFRQHPRYVDLTGADESKMKRFRDSVRSLVHVFGRPVLFKNPHAALRIQPIAKYLPESLFIIMERDEVDNAHSLLEVRHKVYQDYERWWSMEPPSYEELRKLPAHEQVVQQIRHIRSTIEKDLKIGNVDPLACFTLNYEELCRNPEEEMSRLDKFFRLNGYQVERRYSPPEPFQRRSNIRIDRNLYEKVREYAKKN